MHKGLLCLKQAIDALSNIESVLHSHGIFAEKEKMGDEGDVDHDLKIDDRLEVTWRVSFSDEDADAGLVLAFRDDTDPEELYGCMSVGYDAGKNRWSTLLARDDRRFRSREAARIARRLSIPLVFGRVEGRVLSSEAEAMRLVGALAEYCFTRMSTRKKRRARQTSSGKARA